MSVTIPLLCLLAIQYWSYTLDVLQINSSPHLMLNKRQHLACRLLGRSESYKQESYKALWRSAAKDLRCWEPWDRYECLPTLLAVIHKWEQSVAYCVEDWVREIWGFEEGFMLREEKHDDIVQVMKDEITAAASGCFMLIIEQAEHNEPLAWWPDWKQVGANLLQIIWGQ